MHVHYGGTGMLVVGLSYICYQYQYLTGLSPSRPCRAVVGSIHSQITDHSSNKKTGAWDISNEQRLGVRAAFPSLGHSAAGESIEHSNVSKN
jgi:hypothetical protein